MGLQDGLGAELMLAALLNAQCVSMGPQLFCACLPFIAMFQCVLRYDVFVR